MMVFPSMLFAACDQEGIPHPQDDDYDPNEYPQFHVFCVVQLGRAIRWGEHWDNAKVIAKLTPEQCKTVTMEELLDMGLEWHS